MDFTERVTWRGVMISGVPNMAYVFGYFRHSWTLRADLVSDLVARLLEHMQDKGATHGGPHPARRRTPACSCARGRTRRTSTPATCMRSQHLLFKQGDREPWTHMLEHEEEMEILPKADLDDGSLVYR